MSSGIAVNDQCVTAFQDLKLGKKQKYIVFALNAANTEIVVEKTVEKNSSDLDDEKKQKAIYDEFLKNFPENECRYAVYDLEYKTADGVREKIIFYAWSPDTAKVKPKMIYAASKDAIRKKLVGITTEIQGTDFSEVSYETVLEKAKRSSN